MPKLCGKITVKRLAGVVKIVAGSSGAGGGKMQEKTITPSTAAQIVTPDGGYSGLSRVNVEATPLQDKAVAPAASAQVVKADDGSVGLGAVTVGAAPLQSKSIEPKTEPQSVEPDAGFYGLSSVMVQGAAKVSGVRIMEDTNAFALSFTDGTSVEGTADFDEDGNPVSLEDDQGNTVEFSGGYPTSATGSDGHTVSIQWGSEE